jgi:hypothetical protein
MVLAIFIAAIVFLLHHILRQIFSIVVLDQLKQIVNYPLENTAE